MQYTSRLLSSRILRAATIVARARVYTKSEWSSDTRITGAVQQRTVESRGGVAEKFHRNRTTTTIAGAHGNAKHQLHTMHGVPTWLRSSSA